MSETMRVLLMEGVHPVAKSMLDEAGFDVEYYDRALDPEDLLAKIGPYHAIGIRSKTQVTPEVLSRADSLLAIGAFCIGTNQIALDEANRRGVPAFNAPYSSTRSVAELVIAEMIALSRQLGHISHAAHHGAWKKTAKQMHEVRGKTVGIVGYGHIGSQVGILAESIGMRVLYYDTVKKLPLGNATAVPLFGDLLAQSDFVTFHVPGTAETHEMFGEAEMRAMKPGSYLLNLSRGTVVVIPALAAALKSGHIGGAAVDVFPDEPPSTRDPFASELQGIDNVILTPHIGGSTEEAQEAIGRESAEAMIRYLSEGSTGGAVNFPNVDLPKRASAHRLLNVHRNVPGVLGHINRLASDSGANIIGQ
ncbi:MAG: phosphoglycerate dehydrogenase, partial [Myxococcota bacterium]